jgi:Amt family ammonium transporter
MAPGLALFYQGFAGRAETRSAVLVSMVALFTAGAQWALFGYSLAFGPSLHGVVGRLTHPCLIGLAGQRHGNVSALAFALFQMARAGVGAAIVATALSTRFQPKAQVTIVLLWSTLVYDPITHWVWGEHGWLAALGAVDFTGGTVVHLVAGVSALVCVVVCRKLGSGHGVVSPRMAAALAPVGVALVGLGCFAFASGDAISGRGLGVQAFVVTALGGLGGAGGWSVGDSGTGRWRHSATGLCAGVVVGLAAVAVGGGYVSSWSALAIGFIAGAIARGTSRGVTAGLVAGVLAIAAAAGYVSPSTAFAIAGVGGGVCYAAVRFKRRLGDDRSFDVFGIHAMGGLAGGLLTGILAHSGVRGANGALFGNVRLLAVQLVACVATALYAGLMTRAILVVVDAMFHLSPHRSTEGGLLGRAPLESPGRVGL